MAHTSLVPSLDADVQLVLCDFGRSGLAYVETDPDGGGRNQLVRNCCVASMASPRGSSLSMPRKVGRAMFRSLLPRRFAMLPSASTSTSITASQNACKMGL